MDNEKIIKLAESISTSINDVVVNTKENVSLGEGTIALGVGVERYTSFLANAVDGVDPKLILAEVINTMDNSFHVTNPNEPSIVDFIVESRTKINKEEEENEKTDEN